MDTVFTAISIGLGILLFGILLEMFRVTLKSLRRRLFLGKAAIKMDVVPVEIEADRRRHRKVVIHWPVILEARDRKLSALAKDISLGGAFVACDQPLPLQERFQMAVNVPGQQPLKLNAQVVWSNSNMPESRVVTRGMGVKFVWNSEATLAALRETIATCLSDPEKELWLSSASKATPTPDLEQVPVSEAPSKAVLPAGA